MSIKKKKEKPNFESTEQTRFLFFIKYCEIFDTPEVQLFRRHVPAYTLVTIISTHACFARMPVFTRAFGCLFDCMYVCLLVSISQTAILHNVFTVCIFVRLSAVFYALTFIYALKECKCKTSVHSETTVRATVRVCARMRTLVSIAGNCFSCVIRLQPLLHEQEEIKKIGIVKFYSK